MKIIKRDGITVEEFQKEKISSAIKKAMKYGSGIYAPVIAEQIADDIENYVSLKSDQAVTVLKIEDLIYKTLINYGEELTAKAYEGFRAVQAFKRETNTTDDSIMSLLQHNNEDVANENSNKDAKIASTLRDLMAGELSKDIARRRILPAYIVQAHDEGTIHYHDMDYAAQPIFNCCLINLYDMLDNGTVINGRMVESPKSFQTACTVTTQIIAQIASNQYGGQSFELAALAPYVRVSYNKYLDKYLKKYPKEMAEELAYDRMKEEISAGIQTIQYQINTLMTTNGQAPFCTMFMHIVEGSEYEYEMSLLVEEVLKQRIQGIKNEKGVYVTPSFPKLIYVLDENNAYPDRKYWYITKIAAQCSAKRLYPDYISAKRMRKIYEGNVFSPMGCRSFLSPWQDEEGNYKFQGRFNMGVVSLNLPQIALSSGKDMDLFWKIFDERLELVKEALLVRYKLLKGVSAQTSPIHWQHGAIARLGKDETIDKLLENGYATISMGYIGVYEAVKYMTGKSHTENTEFALQIMDRLKKATQKWKEETGLGFGLYGTPAESLCYRFARIDKAKFGSIEDITDKNYYTNSYHVDVRENIDAFSKLKFENQFQEYSTGGCISYVEIPNMFKNIEALEQLITFIYENIQYAEFNTKSDYCQVCEFAGEIKINEDLDWECPNCGNKDKDKMNVVRRTCGYLGDNFWNKGKTQEMKSRVLHL